MTTSSIAFCTSSSFKSLNPLQTTTSFIPNKCTILKSKYESHRTRNDLVHNTSTIYMRKDKKKSSGGRKKRDSSLSREQQDRLKEVAQGFGVQPPRAGADFDRKFTSAESRKTDMQQQKQQKAFYIGLVENIGQKNLETIETATYFILGVLLFAFLGTGLAIASVAFFKSGQKDVPQALDSVVSNVEGLFTPLLFVFLALSSMLGLYKQAQLNAGAAQYDETK